MQLFLVNQPQSAHATSSIHPCAFHISRGDPVSSCWLFDQVFVSTDNLQKMGKSLICAICQYDLKWLFVIIIKNHIYIYIS